jgi:hypothetical protein
MFGIGKKNPEIIEEAVLMLDGLAEDVASGAVGKLVTRQVAPVVAAESVFLPAEDVATRPIELPNELPDDANDKPDNELF